MPAVLIGQLLLFIWLGIAALQSVRVFRFGERAIPKSWIFYISFCSIGIALLDHFGFLDKSLAVLVFFSLFVYFMIYNLTFAFDLYRFSPLINRSEHFFGCILISLTSYAFLLTVSFYTQIPSLAARIILLFCLVTTLGVLNEIVELFFDLVFKTKNIGPGLFDTNLDLLMNALGTGTFLIVAKYFRVL